MLRRERVILLPESTLFSPNSPSPQEGEQDKAQYPTHGHHTRYVHRLALPTATCQALQPPSAWQLIRWCSSTAALQPSAAGLPIQNPPTYFKKDSAHTENPALRKVQDPSEQKRLLGFQRQKCNMLPGTHLRWHPHPAVSNQTHLDAPDLSEVLSPLLGFPRERAVSAELEVRGGTRTKFVLCRNWLVCFFSFKKRSAFLGLRGAE